MRTPRCPSVVIVLSTSARLEGATSWIDTTRKSRDTPGAANTGKNSIVAADSIQSNFRPRYGFEQGEKVERVVLNALSNKLRLGRLIFAPSAIGLASSSEKPIHLSRAHRHNFPKFRFGQGHDGETRLPDEWSLFKARVAFDLA